MSMNPSGEEVPDGMAAPVEEVPWTDDSIRWEGGLYVKTGADGDGDKDSSDEEDYVVDPFK